VNVVRRTNSTAVRSVRRSSSLTDLSSVESALRKDGEVLALRHRALKWMHEDGYANESGRNDDSGGGCGGGNGGGCGGGSGGAMEVQSEERLNGATKKKTMRSVLVRKISSRLQLNRPATLD